VLLVGQVRPELTYPQSVIYDAILRWFETHEYAPTIREIAELAGRSTSNTFVHFVTLEEKGYIKRERNGITRSLRLVK
jgi:DNA-binding MarR family transcriptional regulator